MKAYNRNMSLDSDIESSGDEGLDTCYEQMLYQAVKEDRLTRGVFECAQVLETNPELVTVCVLPVDKSSDISVHIQHKLIEAYCWENDIEVIKLTSTEFSKIASMPRSKGSDLTGSDVAECVLVSSKKLPEPTEVDDELDEEFDNFG